MTIFGFRYACLTVINLIGVHKLMISHPRLNGDFYKGKSKKIDFIYTILDFYKKNKMKSKSITIFSYKFINLYGKKQ